TIYMGFAANTVNLLNGVQTGEAPQLSCFNSYNTITGCNSIYSYGEYDNGANVFTVYQNFAGYNALGVLPSGWNNAGGNTVMDNGLIMQGSGTALYYNVYNTM